MRSMTLAEAAYGSHDPHLLFLRSWLSNSWRGSAAGVPRIGFDPSSVAVSTDSGIREVIGLRVQGHPTCVLGAVQFRRQNDEPASLARQSLVSFLTSPRTNSEVSKQLRCGKLVALNVPSTAEAVEEFVDRLSAGNCGSPTLLDPNLIQLAWDFRSENPSEQKTGRPAKSVIHTIVVRSAEGHVVSGVAVDIRMKLWRPTPFLAITHVVQHTAERMMPLPTLIIHRHFLSMIGVVRKSESIEAWLESSAAFSAKTANSEHLLDPRL